MRTLFTDEFIHALKKRYDRPGTVTPALFNFVTGEFQELRSDVDRTLNALSEECREKFLLSFTNPDTFQTAYNELAVAGYFAGYGYDIVYEIEIDGLTPDWFITASNGFVLFLEVLSRSTSKEVRAKETQITDLWNRLKQIEVPACLWIEYEDRHAPPPLDSAVCKRVTMDARRWLTSEPKPDKGETLNTNGLVLRVAYYHDRRAHVQVSGPSSGTYTVSTDAVKKGIDAKAKKYDQLCVNNGIPLVVGIAPSFAASIDDEDLTNILYGDEVMTVARDGSTSTHIENNGIFAKRKSLSAVIGFWRDHHPDERTRIYYNPGAAIPISKSILEPSNSSPDIENG
ncbi:MAG TPA: hypothetical protein PLL77_10005 [Pyrinomonadaceae bacterium]|nr:hypothetical protein [Pyrinomonadaceae bacterium]